MPSAEKHCTLLYSCGRGWQGGGRCACWAALCKFVHAQVCLFVCVLRT